MQKVRKALFMFTDLFGVERYSYNTLVTFLLAVRTNYRSVVYHNWSHGFHVANSIYSILKVLHITILFYLLIIVARPLQISSLRTSVWACGWEPSVTTWTTEGSTTSS